MDSLIFQDKFYPHLVAVLEAGPDLGFWRSRQKLGTIRQTFLALQAKLGKRIRRPRQK